jgi:futalosine hydrolase
MPEPWSMVSLDRGFDILCTGVGKSNAAGATARFLDPRIHRGVLSVGIAGALPGSGLALGDVVLATRSVFSDEGIGADTGFIPMSQAGFGAFPDGSMAQDHDPTILAQLAPLCDRTGIIATVSWCSGSDGCARGVVERTGAIAEAMEGASVALVAARVAQSSRRALATGEIRAISNTTGDRADQRWAFDESLERLREVLGRVGDTLD